MPGILHQNLCNGDTEKQQDSGLSAKQAQIKHCKKHNKTIKALFIIHHVLVGSDSDGAVVVGTDGACRGWHGLLGE